MKKLLFICTSLLIIFLAYSGHFNNPFEFDDEHTIVNNAAIRHLKNIPSFFSDATTTSSLPANQAYRPGLTTLNAIDYSLGDSEAPQPFFFRVSIFICLLLIWGTLFLLGSKWLKNSSDSFLWSVVLATLFCIHTANSVTINYIIARADSFSTLMVLLAFVLYLYSDTCKKYFLYLGPVIIGFMVKEPAIVFVPLLMLYKLLFERDATKEDGRVFSTNAVLRILKETAIPVILAIGLFLFSRKMTPAHWTSGAPDGYRYIISQPFVILHYFNNFFLPFNLVIDTDWEFVSAITDDRVITGTGFLILLVIAILKSAAKQPLVAFGLAWFLLALMPTSLVPLAEVLNDHRPFFAYVGLAIALVAGLIWLYEKTDPKYRVIFATGISVLILLHGLGTYRQCGIWSSTETVWKEATVKAPKNGRAWMNYGITQMSKANYAEAEMAFNKTIGLLPFYAYVHINLGVLKAEMKQDAEAEEYFKKALRLNSNLPEGYYFYGRFLFRRNRFDEARAIVDEGLNRSRNHSTLNELKNLLKEKAVQPPVAPIDKIAEELKKAEQNPSAENYLNLSLAYYNANKYQECIAACEKALKLKPGYALAYNNICSSYNQLKQWDKAIEAGQKGLSLDPQNNLLMGNLKVAIQGKENKQ